MAATVRPSDNNSNNGSSNKNKKKEVSARRTGIDSCLKWLHSLRIDDDDDGNKKEDDSSSLLLYDKIAFEADHSGDHDGIGVYNNKKGIAIIQQGETILSFPMAAALTLDHALFQGPELSRFLETCRHEWQQQVLRIVDESNNNSVASPYDRYAKMKGRVLLKNYVLLSFLVTLMWMQQDDDNNTTTNTATTDVTTTTSTSSIPTITTAAMHAEVSKARQYWSSMMETEPHDWSHVPLLWKEQDLQRIRGTSFYALTVRMQQEMHQVFYQVFWPALQKMSGVANDDDNNNNNTKNNDPTFSTKQSADDAAWYSKFQLALAFVYSHTHSKQQEQEEDMKLAANGLLRLNLNDSDNGRQQQTFVDPIPICFPIVDLINGTRRTKDANGELIATATTYRVVATRDIQAGEEICLCYGEDTLNNLDFFVKFGYIPLNEKGYPVLVPEDFVTLPLGPQLRPQVVGDNPKTNAAISKLDQLRWTELERSKMGRDRLVEPIPYFQRPFYLNGNLETARRLRNSSAFSAGPGVSIAQIDKLEQYVMTMLANKQALKKLSEGKIPPPPMLEGWEPGQRMVQILDYYLEEHTTLSETTTEQDLEASATSTTQTGNQQLATHARMVERELVLIWRHAIASHHGLYRAEKARVERLPKSNKSCCVQCRTSLSIFPCPKCRSVCYCSEACQQYDWDKGGHSRLCALFAAKNKA